MSATLQLPNQIVIDDRPGQIAAHLEALRAYERANAEALARVAAERKQLRREQVILSGAGMAAIIAGFLLGTSVHPILFLIFAVGLAMMVWAGRVPGRRLQKLESSPPADLTGRCAAAIGLLGDLRDDLARGRKLSGQIDLRPIEQFGRVGRERPGPGQTKVSYFYHSWLRLALRLADGNDLRLEAVERLKLNPGHYRLGSVSRKRKWRPARRSFRQRLVLRLRLNPEVYEIAAGRPPQALSRAGGLRVLRSDLRGGELRLLAESDADRLAPGDVLGLLRQVYAGLRRRPR